jgi:hypothetical protein
MKLTEDISTSPHAAATQVGDETVIVIMSRDASLALADRGGRTAGGRFEDDWGTLAPLNTAHLVETNSP